MSRLYISPKNEKAIREYCEANDIEDVNAFANRCAFQGLTIIKYGTSPMDNALRERMGKKDVKEDKVVKKPLKVEEVKEEKKEEVIVSMPPRKIQIIKKS